MLQRAIQEISFMEMKPEFTSDFKIKTLQASYPVKCKDILE